MKGLKVFWLRRSIATRMTALVAVMLALVCALWTWFAWLRAVSQVRNNAHHYANQNERNITAVLQAKNYNFTNMPSPDTPEFYRLRADLHQACVGSPFILQYFDNKEPVVIPFAWQIQGMLCYEQSVGYQEGIIVDISDFSAEDILSFESWLGKQEIYESPDYNPKLTVHGVLLDIEDDWLYFFPNRLETEDGHVWHSQTPVPEQDTSRLAYLRKTPDSLCDSHLNALRYLQAFQNDASFEELVALQDNNFVTSMSPYDTLTVYASHVYDYYGEIASCFASFPIIVSFLCLLLLWLFYHGVRRAVIVPLYSTTRQAQHVAHLEFDAFHPDTARGDEIGDLNRALADMAGDLHQRWDSERDLEDRRQQFVAAASHDLKTPLALIGGYAEAIAQDISPEENARYLAAIEQETGRMNTLVREMLDYTRLDRTDELEHRTAIDLSDLIHSLVDEYTPLFEHRRLTADLAPGVRIRGDETLLRRAFGCLLENAAKYSPEGGHVAVTLRKQGGPLLTVENDCDPIPESELSRLFEMFYRGDKARNRAGGHGLGLAITQKILALHGLTCRAENTKTGVRFDIVSR